MTDKRALTLDGHFRAYDAHTGAKLWEYDNQAATMAGPITYAVGGEQYVATLASYGTLFYLPAGFAIAHPPTAPQLGRVNVFRLGGDAHLPARDLVPVEMPRPPAIRASATIIAQGGALYGRFCMVCHGAGAISGGVVPDLRRSAALQDHNVWLQTVHGGRPGTGMPDFTQWTSPRDVEAIRAYVAHEANGENAAPIPPH